MDGGTIPTSLTLYLMLTICLILVSVDILEMVKLINAWAMKNKIEPFYFETCIKSDLLVKTAFSIFSLLAAFSAFLLVVMMIVAMEFFINKLLSAFLYLNYMVFGLYMLGFSIFGLVHWNDVAYMCDRKFPNEKVFSIGNMFSLIGCFVLSLVITFGVSIYETMTLYSDSILRRNTGSKLLRTVFWWVVFHGRGEEEIRPRAEINREENPHAPQHENYQRIQNQNQEPHEESAPQVEEIKDNV